MMYSIFFFCQSSFYVKLLCFVCNWRLSGRKCTESDCTMKYLQTSAITSLFLLLFLCSSLHSFLHILLQDKDSTPLSLSLIRPWSQILILAGVKTPSPLRSGDSSFSSVACSRQEVMELLPPPLPLLSVTSLTHWYKDNAGLFALSCNYADLRTHTSYTQTQKRRPALSHESRSIISCTHVNAAGG